jgi:hypothetical protein
LICLSKGSASVLELPNNADSVAHIIQIALTPVFLLTGIASLLNVFSTRLNRIADRVDSFVERLETADPSDRGKLDGKLKYLQRRTHLLDGAVIIGTIGGGATCCAALLLFVSSLRDRAGVSLFVTFGLALLLTVCALGLFLLEMLLASAGIRVHIENADATVNSQADAKR